MRLTALNTVKELMSDIGRPRGNFYEPALLEDLLTVRGKEAFYAYMVDKQAIVIPESIDAIRPPTRCEGDPEASIARTNAALGIGSARTLGRTGSNIAAATGCRSWRNRRLRIAVGSVARMRGAA